MAGQRIITRIWKDPDGRTLVHDQFGKPIEILSGIPMDDRVLKALHEISPNGVETILSDGEREGLARPWDN